MFRVPSNRATSGWRAALFVALNCAVILHASAARAPHDALGLEFKTGLNATTSSRMPHLRVLVLGEHANQAHRRDALEFAILADYAKQHHVILDWLPVFRPKELYERLLHGDADIAIGAMPPELSGQPALANTHPLTTQRYQLIGRAGAKAHAAMLSATMRKVAAEVPFQADVDDFRRVLTTGAK